MHKGHGKLSGRLIPLSEMERRLVSFSVCIFFSTTSSCVLFRTLQEGTEASLPTDAYDLFGPGGIAVSHSQNTEAGSSALCKGTHRRGHFGSSYSRLDYPLNSKDVSMNMLGCLCDL